MRVRRITLSDGGSSDSVNMRLVASAMRRVTLSCASLMVAVEDVKFRDVQRAYRAQGRFAVSLMEEVGVARSLSALGVPGVVAIAASIMVVVLDVR